MANDNVRVRMRICNAMQCNAMNALKSANIHVNELQKGSRTHSKLDYSYLRACSHPPHCRLCFSFSLAVVHFSHSRLWPYLEHHSSASAPISECCWMTRAACVLPPLQPSQLLSAVLILLCGWICDHVIHCHRLRIDIGVTTAH